ncbi:hypothetical protein [Dactylosporangium darangshiense]
MPRVPFSPRLVILLTSVGPALFVAGFGLHTPDAWIMAVVGGTLTCAGIAYIWLTRPHSRARWMRAWFAGQWGYRSSAGRASDGRDEAEDEPRGLPRQRPLRRTGMSRRLRRRKR